MLSTGSKECEKVDGSGRRRHTSQFSNIRMDGLFCLSSWQAVNALAASELSGHSRLTLKDTIYPELTGSLTLFSSSLRAAKARYGSAVLMFVGGVKLVGDNPHNHVSHKSGDFKF